MDFLLDYGSDHFSDECGSYIKPSTVAAALWAFVTEKEKERRASATLVRPEKIPA